METAGIYGLSKALHHHCLSLNAIVANRINKNFTKDVEALVEKLIVETLRVISSL